MLRSTPAEDASLDEHLCHLLDQLDRVAHVIRELTERDIEADFFCGLFLDAFNRGADIAPETLRRIARLNATLGLDIHGFYETPTLLDVIEARWWSVITWRRRRRWRLARPAR